MDYIRRHAVIIRELYNQGEPFYLMGHSFGGILAQELALLLEPRGVILLNTVRSGSELPTTLSLLRRIPIYQLLLKEGVKRSYFLWGETDGYNTPEERHLFYEMTDRHSDYYFRWAVRHIVHWEGGVGLSCNVLRLHGDLDRVFPIKYITDPAVISLAAGSHIMVKGLAEEVSQHINEFLSTDT